ncbi:MAG: amidohydrolase family protein [Deltaproteobacteria bacterium]|nr:amidohydrolase family protein [Deltaproteobacteria bacterium]
MVDLSITGGTLVIPGVGVQRAGLAVDRGRVMAIGAEGTLPAARRTVEASGLHVFPGFIDPHVHLGQVLGFEKELRTESRSALAGGITTLGIHVRKLQGSYLPEMEATIKAVEAQASTDVFYHLQLFTPEQVAEVPQYARAFGVTSFKAYMCGMAGFTTSVDDGLLLEAFQAVRTLGDEAILAVHCENEPLVNDALARLRQTKPEGGTLADWAESHPAIAEEEAIIRAAFLAAQAGARLYVVHLNTRLGVERLRRIRREQPGIYVETTSPYLSVTRHDPIGLLGKMVLPLRDTEDVEALWAGVRDDVIDTFGTDNTGRPRAGKQPEKGMWEARTGYPVLGTHVPVLLHEGYHRRGIPLVKLAEKGALNPARIFGLYPRKGTIAVGGDADLVLVDLEREEVVDPSVLHSFTDWSLWEGKRLKGWPVMTVRGGVVAAEGHRLLVEPGGVTYLRRAPSRSPQ